MTEGEPKKPDIVQPAVQPNQLSQVERWQIKAARFFSGPIPPPDVLDGYNHVIPNGAERLLVLTEKQQDHRQRLEAQVVGNDVLLSRLGLIFGFVLAAAIIGGGIYFIAIDKPIAGFAMLIGQVSVLVGAFYYSDKRKQQNLARRAGPAYKQPELQDQNGNRKKKKRKRR